ncbi:histone acetyltransferase type B [Macrolepiota fuliginosa MF-IS2]|uniref:Histone acetyltransferase type B catalytic subunit n=1 Tax=Macrolepiota fuliginosa MF-IS2 TaxID=1400762 RepID=A0A9P5XFL2_9AGAR|nr:histone acetyltransferase type B [Macrolepiota fuliginosa MF-IS2]
MADWTADSNEALTLSLVRSKLDKDSLAEGKSYEDFHPTFTYPIYGDDEKIYGYKDLVIDLRFTSGSLTQYLNVQYSEKLATSSTVDDVEGTLAKFIPPGYYTDEEAFGKCVEEDATTFKPYGELIYSYTKPSPVKGKGRGVSRAARAAKDVVYEVYHTTWDTPGFREYHRKMQLFILLYIEAGSFINEEEDPWEFVVLYEKQKRPGSDVPTYHFVGYSSLYSFYHFPEKTRLRLSQFVILPPYQKQGLGSQLYKAIYQYVLSKPSVAELTVEDPAEAFEDLRDKNDMEMLQSHRQFIDEAYGSSQSAGGRVGGIGRAGRSGRGGAAQTKGKLGPPADKVWVEKWRKDLKIAGRQFQRLIEMIILLRLDPHDARALKAYRLQVKERLYRFNFEVLVHLDKQERLDKLEETFQSVCDDYARILGHLRQ